jgi:hypothetical protein
MSFAATIETIKIWRNYFFGSLERGKGCKDDTGKEINYTFGINEDKVNNKIITKLVRFEKYSTGREYKVYSGSVAKGTASYWKFPIRIVAMSEIHYPDIDVKLIEEAIGITGEDWGKLRNTYAITPQILISCFIKLLIKTDYYYLRDNKIDPTLPYTSIYVYTIQKVEGKEVKSKKQTLLFPQVPEPIVIDESKIIYELIQLSKMTPKIPIKTIERHFRKKFNYSSYTMLNILKDYEQKELITREDLYYRLNKAKIREYIKEMKLEMPKELKPKKRKSKTV